MKGLSLPINVVVIIIVALIVLIAVAAFFSRSLSSGESAMAAQEKWQRACSAFKMRGWCDVGGDRFLDQIKIDGTPMWTNNPDENFLCKTIGGAVLAEDCCNLCCGSGVCG